MFNLRSILERPAIYTIFQKMVGSHGFTKEFITKYIRPQEGDFILDIGCGPAEILNFLPPVNYYGFDSNCRYIEEAKRKYDKRGRFFCSDLKITSLPEEKKFDIVLASKVLHHLDDKEVVQLFRLAERFLKQGGKLITCDGCHTPDEGIFSKFLASLDRGKYIRDADGYLRLSRQVFAEVKYEVRNDLLNIPGSCIFICCTR